MSKAPRTRQLASHAPEVGAAVRLGEETIANAGPAYDKCWNELAALLSTVAMEDATKREITGLMDLLYVIRLAHLKAERIFRDVAALTISKAPEIVKGVQRTKGGRQAGIKRKKKAEPRHQTWIDQARKHIASGTAPRDLSSLLAKRYIVNSKTMRNVLQDAELVPRRRS